jgi:hypothetical protein
MCKKREEEKTVWQFEREEMQGEVNKCVNILREEVRAAENAKVSLEEMRKGREEETTVWQREREEMLRQVKRLREEVMAAENDNTTLGDICKENEEEKTVCQCERQAIQEQVNKLREDVLAEAKARRCWRRCTRKVRRIRQSGSARGKTSCDI